MVFVIDLSYDLDMTSFKMKTVFESQPTWQLLVIVLIFNTLVAVVMNSFIYDGTFYFQMIMSQSIGLSIFLCFVISANIIGFNKWNILVPLIVGAPIGVVIGIFFQSVWVGSSFELVIQNIKGNYVNVLSTVFSALFFGSVIVIIFAGREHIFRTKARLQAEKIDNLQHKKTISETNLRLLQAQIEPHFLFNTLSNVISLIENDPAKSRKLLESLTDFLRATLKRSTDTNPTLKDEVGLVRDYLEIMKMRVGRRLEYNIYMNDDIAECAFPPLLLQPLVENAIKHGVEPLAEGGVINVLIKKENQKLVVTVSDTGKGLSTHNIKGFGLTNIRERISTMYGDDGSLVIEENKSCGVTAIIEVPYESV